MVTVQADADAANFAADEKTCGIKAGDQMTLGDLLHGLLMESGNDAAVAIADYIGGNSEQFAQMMNEEAQALMATKTHFLNSNGLHNENHYTTAYDLYLIFNECIKHDEFVDIINTAEYTANITGADKTVRQAAWKQTNFYALGGSRASAERDDYWRENRYHGTCRELPDSSGEGCLRQAVHIYRHGSRYKIPAIPGHDSNHQWDRAARTRQPRMRLMGMQSRMSLQPRVM
ncbi:MAG: D-alanyl-D-alanine carboxypeptidase family protein [[Clostridium] scindens]